MTSLRTMYLLFLAAFLFLFLSVVPTEAEVVNSVADCNQFLLHNNPPNLPDILEGGNIQDQNRYKPICQTYENLPRFLTLYDINNKIPVFSAYKYIGEGTGATRNDWKIEPQLEDETLMNNMEDEGTGQIYNHQASSANYQSNIYDRGHLYPKSHASTEHDRESTYTLTNMVPQIKTFNQGSWSKMEGCVKKVMNTYCKKSRDEIEGFVVTGAQPNTEEPSAKKLNDKVNVPSIIWSAFCCYYYDKNMWIASAHWGDNDGDVPAFLPSQTLTALHNRLGGATTNLFPGTQCPLDKTLGDYPTLQINFRECKP